MKNIEIYELVAEVIEKKFQVSDKLKDELWYETEYDSYGLILNECRKHYRDQSKTIKMPIFKLKFNQKSKLWSVYWMRANNKWYKLHEEKEISDMIEYVDKDELGCFFG